MGDRGRISPRGKSLGELGRSYQSWKEIAFGITQLFYPRSCREERKREKFLPAVWPQMSSQSEATLADGTATKKSSCDWTLTPSAESAVRSSRAAAITQWQVPVCCQRHNSHQPVISHDRSDHRFHGRGIAWTIGSAAHRVNTRLGSQSNRGIFIKIIHGLAVRVGDKSGR